MKFRDLVPQRKQANPPVERHPFLTMQREMNRLFENFADGFDWDWTMAEAPFSPVVDMREADGKLLISAELPGITPENVKVTTLRNRLCIEGEKRSETDKERDGYHYTERAYGSFSRSLTLPEGTDVDSAEAVFKDGVLRLEFAKTPADVDAHEIPINA